MELGSRGLGMRGGLEDSHAVRETTAKEIVVCTGDVGEGACEVKISFGRQVEKAGNVMRMW